MFFLTYIFKKLHRKKMQAYNSKRDDTIDILPQSILNNNVY